MKEIDFIPEWYKANQSRKKSYRRQYVLLASLLAIMMVWSFIVGKYVERVRADVEDIQSVYEKGEMKVNGGMQLESEIALLQKQIRVIEAVSPRTDVSAIISELSWLIRDNIILSKLTLKNETIQQAKQQGSKPAGVVQVGTSNRKNDASVISLEPTRTCVVLAGIAAKGADAADLISRLEDSDYFEQVTPVFTRAKKVKDYNVTEFEIRCYVADYKFENQE